MKPPFAVDKEGVIRDGECVVIGGMYSNDPDVLAKLIFRLNLFDDMLRVIDLQSRYTTNLPPMAVADIGMTTSAAKLA